MNRFPTHRRATTLHELLVAIALLGSLATVILPASVKLMRVRQSYRDRLIAMEELANQLERLAVVDPEQLPTAVKQVTLSESAEQRLQQAALQATAESGQRGTRVQVQVSWSDRWGQPVPPVSLTTWLFPDESQPATTESKP